MPPSHEHQQPPQCETSICLFTEKRKEEKKEEKEIEEEEEEAEEEEEEPNLNFPFMVQPSMCMGSDK